jgi:hypothetical protein
MRLEKIAEYSKTGALITVTYLVDGTQWARLTGYTPNDIRIVADALEQVK